MSNIAFKGTRLGEAFLGSWVSPVQGRCSSFIIGVPLNLTLGNLIGVDKMLEAFLMTTRLIAVFIFVSFMGSVLFGSGGVQIILIQVLVGTIFFEGLLLCAFSESARNVRTTKLASFLAGASIFSGQATRPRRFVLTALVGIVMVGSLTFPEFMRTSF